MCKCVYAQTAQNVNKFKPEPMFEFKLHIRSKFINKTNLNFQTTVLWDFTFKIISISNQFIVKRQKSL